MSASAGIFATRALHIAYGGAVPVHVVFVTAPALTNRNRVLQREDVANGGCCKRKELQTGMCCTRQAFHKAVLLKERAAKGKAQREGERREPTRGNGQMYVRAEQY